MMSRAIVCAAVTALEDAARHDVRAGRGGGVCSKNASMIIQSPLKIEPVRTIV